jgi:integrase
MRAYAALHVPGILLSISLGEYLSQWLLDSDWRPNTYALRELLIRVHIVPEIGNRPVQDVNADDVKRLIRRLRERGVGSATIQKVYETLRCALNQLYREGKIVVNPCNQIARPRHKKKDAVVLDRAEIERLITIAEGLELITIVLAAQTAIREGEMFGLLWSAVDFERRQLTIARQVTEDLSHRLVLSEPKTTSGTRRIALPKLAYAVLKAWRARQISEGYTGDLVLPDAVGGFQRKSNFIRRIFKPLLKRAGVVDVTFHSLRHSANSFLIEEGADPLVIMRVNGWTNTKMVYDHYGHFFDRRNEEAAEAMDRTFAGVRPGRQIVVNRAKLSEQNKTPIPKKLLKSASNVVEVRRLELLTPYMRSKCSTN